MNDLPPLAIGLVTYKRTDEAMETINSTCLNLDYPKELRRWYVADDGSPGDHYNTLLEALRVRGETILGSSHDRLRLAGAESSYYSGLVWNRALGVCHQYSDFVLWLEDDWRLEEQLNFVPYVKLLQDREDVGIVSFRVLSVGNDVHTEGHAGIHYLRYLHTTQYAYSGNPHLRHARYTKHYGWFHEERNPGGIELEYDDRYRLDDTGPAIWRPVGISPWGAWVHIGTEKAYR
jgi:GT2 family glycosyltransferase